MILQLLVCDNGDKNCPWFGHLLCHILICWNQLSCVSVSFSLCEILFAHLCLTRYPLSHQQGAQPPHSSNHHHRAGGQAYQVLWQQQREADSLHGGPPGRCNQLSCGPQWTLSHVRQWVPNNQFLLVLHIFIDNLVSSHLYYLDWWFMSWPIDDCLQR